MEFIGMLEYIEYLRGFLYSLQLNIEVLNASSLLREV